MTFKEFLQRYAAGERDFSEINLEGSGFIGTDFRLANPERDYFTCAELEDTNFSNANLSKVCFERIEIRNCNFTGANLQEASLAEAAIFDSNLKEANLDGFSMIEAVIEGCNMEGVSLRNAELGDSGIGGSNLPNANLEGRHGEISVGDIDFTGAIGFNRYLVSGGYYNITLPDGRFIADWLVEEI
ncbi:pentapeptide repeat-containing protein [Calothrix sp. CCY 0018]|uniref:pentapeptide repeat-containing protein n=1 Tax=Calothrix sp. CCY 0018 TaxID=3103864 RepID=UPI0039C6F735